MILLQLPLLQVLAATPALPPAEVELVWAPEPGIALHRSYQTRHLLAAELQSMQALSALDRRTGGEGQRSLSQKRFELTVTQSLRVSDRLLARDDERPTSLRRFFEHGGFKADMETDDPTGVTRTRRLQGKSSFENKSVVFTWVPEDQEYGRYFDAQEGPEEILPGLELDLSMSSLLPEGPVALGAQWSLPPAVLGEVLSLGGRRDVSLSNERGEAVFRTMRVGVGYDVFQLFGEREEGEVAARLIGLEESEAGHQLALIDLDFDVLAEREMRGLANSDLNAFDVMRGVKVESALVKVTLKGKGVVIWDATGNHLHEVRDLKADEQVSTHLQRTFGQGDEEVLEIQDLVMVGTLLHSVKVTEN